MLLCNENCDIYSKSVKYSSGFLNCFVEIIINARDRNFEDTNSNSYEVIIDRNTNMISVKNNGNGVNTKDMKSWDGKVFPNP